MRTAAVLGALFALGLAAPPSASADPPAPSDYRAEVVGIQPATEKITATIHGGDSFIEVSVEPGVEAAVAGYFGEPYLRFTADGTVEENQASPTYAANSSRYGSGSDAAADAPPDWHRVSSDGSYLWHDHRTHWMSTEHPPGKSPGDVILDGSIEIVVDGVPTMVQVRSTWLEAPSRIPPITGVIVGATVAMLVMRRRGRGWGRIAFVAACAALGLATGLAKSASVPAAAGYPMTAWLLPAISAAIAIAASVRWRQLSAWTHLAVLTLAATPLIAWGWSQRTGLTLAWIPTIAPRWLDRGLVGFVFAAAAVTLLISLVGVWSVATPRPAPAEPIPARPGHRSQDDPTPNRWAALDQLGDH